MCVNNKGFFFLKKKKACSGGEKWMLLLPFNVTGVFSVWRLGLNAVYAFFEFVGLLGLCCIFVKPASVLREDSNVELTVGMTYTYSL